MSPAGTDPVTGIVRSKGAEIWDVVLATGAASLGILALAAGLAGFLFHRMGPALRMMSLLAAALILFPEQGIVVAGKQVPITDLAGAVLLVVVGFLNWKSAKDGIGEEQPAPEASS